MRGEYRRVVGRVVEVERGGTGAVATAGWAKMSAGQGCAGGGLIAGWCAGRHLAGDGRRRLRHAGMGQMAGAPLDYSWTTLDWAGLTDSKLFGRGRGGQAGRQAAERLA